MKKLLSLLLLFCLGILQPMALPPAEATVTNQALNACDRSNGITFYCATYVAVTANDTTTPINGNAFGNADGRVTGVSVIANVTASTGTSPTLQLILQGSNDGSNFYTLQSSQGTPAAIQTSAQSVSSAVVFGFDTAQFQRTGGYPRYLRIQTVTGGSSSPGWTGTLTVFVKKSSQTNTGNF